MVGFNVSINKLFGIVNTISNSLLDALFQLPTQNSTSCRPAYEARRL